MAKIALIANTCKSKAAYLETCRLPTFYMEDFSILGILVEKYDTARALLKDGGYNTIDRKISTDVMIDHVEQIRTILTTLKQHGIVAELSDIADTMYQA